MIIKLTTAVKNETVYVNFDFVRTMRRDGSFTELTMSDDKYHKLTVVELPEVIYEILSPVKSCGGNCHCQSTETEAVSCETPATEVKKPAAKKTTIKTAETV